MRYHRGEPLLDGRKVEKAVGSVKGRETTMGALQPLHLALVIGVVLLVFGPKKLPQLAKGIGESIRELKKTLHGVTDSEPVVAAKEIGQTVKDLKQDLNPLAPPAPRRVVSPAPSQSMASTPPAAVRPETETPQS
jgi:sec-independent protein translocase protein TatA